MPPIVLKIEGNESFLSFSNLDQDELSKTWRVCTKVKDSLENGSRLENLSWRLWFIQNVTVANDAKTTSKHPKTTEKMELQKEIESTKQLEPRKQQPLPVNEIELQPAILPQPPQSVLDYSLDEIKPVATENFILNQFTSDQEGDLMVELKDIFPLGMQDFMHNTPEGVNAEKQPWITSEGSMNNYPVSCTTASTTPAVSQSFSSSSNNVDSDLIMGPISGIYSLYADPLEVPSLSISSNINAATPSYEQPEFHQDQHELIAELNKAAATAAAALTTLPNATLHNKLLATLPPQTLASAEKLLSPAKNRPVVQPISQEQKQQQRAHTSLPLSVIPNNNSQQHYYNTFQLNPYKNSLSSTTKRRYHSSTATSPSLTTLDEIPPACSNCDATSTPLWRRSADDEILCNACGLYLKLHNTSRPKHLNPTATGRKQTEANDSTQNSNTQQREDKYQQQFTEPHTACSNCGTIKTPLWRRDTEGAPLCNACGL
ncbi:hypothetical protein BD408DRAFT_27585 [Parasitella parasitica]|nr:hypothetical protein BD408DRAFT_27585 [Parasitella parasitica]